MHYILSTTQHQSSLSHMYLTIAKILRHLISSVHTLSMCYLSPNKLQLSILKNRELSCSPTTQRHMLVCVFICQSAGQLQLQGPNSSCEVLP